MRQKNPTIRKRNPYPTSLFPRTYPILISHVLTLSVAVWTLSVCGQASELEVNILRTVEISSSYRYCWYPGIHQFSTGEIMATMRMNPDEWHPEGEFSAYCISRDGGLTWSHRYTMGAGANNDGAFSREPRKDGAIWSLWNWMTPDPPGQSKQLRATLTKYARGGMEVQQIRDVIVRFNEAARMEPQRMAGFGRLKDVSKLEMTPDVWMFGSILEALNGDLLATVCLRLERDKGDPIRTNYYHSMLLRSSDNGKTWREYSTIAAVEPGEEPWSGMGSAGPSETGLVRLADKRLYGIFRTGGFMGNVWSSDDGKNWTRPVSTPFKGVAPRIRRLSNGVLACTYGRPGPVTIMFSLDGTGEKWSHVTELFAGMSTRYTDLIEVEPGKVLVVYDSVPYGWNPVPYAPTFVGHDAWGGITHPLSEDARAKNTIYGTFVEVKRK